jgi:hypothetical protein
MHSVAETPRFGNARFGIVRQVRRHPDARKTIHSVSSVKNRSQRVGRHPDVYNRNAFVDRLRVDVGIDLSQSFKCIVVIAAFGDDPIEGFRIPRHPGWTVIRNQAFEFPLTNHPAADKIQPYRLAVLLQLLD